GFGSTASLPEHRPCQPPGPVDTVRTPSADPGVVVTTDINVTIANLIEDLAEIQSAKQSQMGYRRAAHAILLLERQVTDLTPPGGELPKIPGVGPKSLRVVEEVLATGKSATVDALVEASGKTAAIARRRELRRSFLSRARVLATIADDTLPGPRPSDYR